eukprot:CAMPEP_0116908140 /NCGR_PEP_ID=MMETSP0467-20121206/13521_1 /TAXON_ID=283647 /ORGANISM="Mesodinium pulex, Strain SPMC105" /LENGTH=101 /DNA_ID=CAMNT_0004583287 /DNA_START=245 /DNA_END=550 /DNA_ORIENTATION=-
MIKKTLSEDLGEEFNVNEFFKSEFRETKEYSHLNLREATLMSELLPSTHEMQRENNAGSGTNPTANPDALSTSTNTHKDKDKDKNSEHIQDPNKIQIDKTE